jgi:hypothetical protein
MVLHCCCSSPFALLVGSSYIGVGSSCVVIQQRITPFSCWFGFLGCHLPLGSSCIIVHSSCCYSIPPNLSIFWPISLVCYSNPFMLLFGFPCCYFFSWFGTSPPLLLYKFGNNETGSTIELFFYVWFSNYACNFVLFCLDVHVYISFILVIFFFYVLNSIYLLLRGFIFFFALL